MNRTALILSGPTHEYIDPVRFIGNASSGRMGRALANEAGRRGCRVEFVSGPVPAATLPDLGTGGTIHRVVSAQDMLATASRLFADADIILFAAAVADYAPAEFRKEKITKTGADLTLSLRPTPDIAKTLCAKKQSDQIAIGFALQTSEGEAHAQRKLKEKRFDAIVLNTPASLGAADGLFSFLRADRPMFDTWGRIDKEACAMRIFDAVEDLLNR